MYPWIRKFLFLLDAEQAHNLVLRLLSFPWLVKLFVPKQSRIPQLGLSAGLDKNAVALQAWDRLGFGFVEIGTITPRPQVGQDKPRLFRIPKDLALFNHMGFNNQGAHAVAQRLAHIKPKLSSDFKVGLNIGKNKDTPDEHALQDYVAALKPFLGLIDFVVVNVSSPNTPGLRALQTEDVLLEIFKALKQVAPNLELFCKLAPELTDAQLATLFTGPLKEWVDGWVLSNTLAGTGPNLKPGGFSGGPLQKLARKRLEVARSLTTKKVISVGGIFDAEDFQWRLSQGAYACEVYTGFVYEGPNLISKIRASLESR